MSKKCLIVDDVEVCRYACRVVLEPLDIQVEEVETLEACMEKVATTRFDLIILDWHIRRESSASVVADIRKSAVNGSAKILVCSGVDIADAEKEAVHAHVDGFVAKPVTQEKLEDVLRRLRVI